MKLLETAHGYFETGSDIADAVLRRHRDRWAASLIDSVVVPFRDGMGDIGTVRIMVGRAYTISSTTVPSVLPELRDPEAVAHILDGPDDDELSEMRYMSAEMDRLELPDEVCSASGAVHSDSTAVASWGAPTGFDSAEPRWRR
jgi:hypothetical protein